MKTAVSTFPVLPGYTIIEKIAQGTSTEIYRAIRNSDHHRPVVIKLLRQEHPRFHELAQFRNQYAIAHPLNHSAIVSPIALEHCNHGYVLVMPDNGLVCLSNYWKRQHYSSEETVASVFAIAIQLSSALHYLMGQSIIHKDIKPDNILIHPDTGQIQLIDFSIASALTKERQELANPSALEGTLAYISPEQTGRMNRGIDYRSDFYSLGVTLYELLTGTLPFATDDPMTVLHQHMATPPPFAHAINPDIPPTLSAIIVKLMAKNAEDRYQSALGIKADLERCQQLWKKHNRPSKAVQNQGHLTQESHLHASPYSTHRLQENQSSENLWFPLGEQDVSDRFLIPEKLYGRQTEVDTLLEAFERVSKGCPELMLVAGLSGIGKTAVVNEVHKPITRQRGYFIQGKYDQFNRNIPFSAFVQGFRSLIRQILGESDRQLSQWRQKILNAVGTNGQLIIEVIPELGHIIGSQPVVPELLGTAAQNRFNLVFSKFVQVFTTQDHPLVLFLDDLQWADSASLNLLKLLIEGTSGEGLTGYLLVIGAYRNNEVLPGHPLILSLEEIQKLTLQYHRSPIQTLTLEPLQLKDVALLVSDTLHCSSQMALPLAELVYQKTKGNPFFTSQFLQSLHAGNCVTFNRETGCWQCDLAQAEQLAITDDVVEFMILQLRKLPQETQDILKVAACIGNRFDLETLAIVRNAFANQPESNQPESNQLDSLSRTQVTASLWIALQDGLIIPEEKTYKFFHPIDQPVEPIESGTTTYRFLHDRVQQAAYALIPHSEKEAIHFNIGQGLLNRLSLKEHDELLFTIVGQLNMGQALLTSQSERNQLAQLNLQAGRKAKFSTAYGAAVEYLTVAQQLLPPSCWEDDYSSTLDIFVETLDVLYLNTQFEQVTILSNTILAKTRTLLDAINVYEVQIRTAVGQGDQHQALKIGLQVLEQMEIPLLTQQPESVADVASLINAPAMTDLHTLAAMKIMANIVTPAWSVNPIEFCNITFTMVDLSLKHGNCAASAFGYAWYGTLLCEALGNIDEGYEFGRLSVALLDRFDTRELRSKILNLYASCTRFWKEPLRASFSIHREGLQRGLDAGDLEFASYCAAEYCQYLWLAGVPLDQVKDTAQQKLSLIKHLKQQFHLDYLAPILQGTLNLMGDGDGLSLLQGAIYDEQDRLPDLVEQKQLTTVFVAYFSKSILSYLAGDMMQAIAHGQEARDHSAGVTGTFFIPAELFYSSLARIAAFDAMSPAQQQTERQDVNKCLTKLNHWATYAPMNFQHKCDLLTAEIARYDQQRAVALEAYDRAISGAKANEYLQDEAIANECAAKFYLDWGKADIAASYIQEAYVCYSRWGARAKIEVLEQQYPQLLQPMFQSPLSNSFFDSLTTIAPPQLSVHSSTTVNPRFSSVKASSVSGLNTSLDLTAILQSTQAISESLRIEDLIPQLTRIILQNSGGDRGILILPYGDESGDSNGSVASHASAVSESEQWHVRAFVHHSHGEIATSDATDLCSEPLALTPNIPSKLIRYVKNTGEAIVVDNLETDAPIVDDYLIQTRPQSLLCLPMMNQGTLVGIFYLQNQTTRGVFTSDRIVILNFLCSQAASCLEKARLYQQSQQNAKKLQQSLMVLGRTREELLNNECMMRMQALALVDLSQNPAIAAGDLVKAFTALTEVTAKTLQIERVSIWLFNPEQTQIQCADLYTYSTQHHSNGAVLNIDQYPIYFDAIALDPILAVQDVWNNASTVELRHGYLDALNIASMLDASFYMDCEIRGVVCCEHVGAMREWSQADQNFVRSVASLIALTLESERRQKKSEALEQALNELQDSQLQLVQNEKMSALGNLVAGIAHEINNPLGFVSGNVSELQLSFTDIVDCLQAYRDTFPDPGDAIQALMDETELDFVLDDLPKMMESMKAGCDRIREISTSLRIFSRADTESKVTANIHEGIDSTLLILKYRLKAKDFRPQIAVIRDYGTLPDILCFPGQLNQVFMNILANAIDMFNEMAETQSSADLKAHPQQIKIHTAQVDTNTIEICITDNGKGMSEEVRSRIFDRKFTTKAVGKGTGLGLAIAHQVITEKHRGRLEVQSKLSQGTEFRILLPIA